MSGARAFWIEAPHRGVIREAPLRAPARDEALVRAMYSGISRGTESLVFRGEVPESERERMRAPFQEGELPGPVKYGYISVGTVEDGPGSLLGREVLCLHPHQSRYVVPASALHPLPEGLPAARAVLGPYMETAVNALWDAPPRVGDRVVVVGGGALGCLVAWLAARVPGCTVHLVDVEPARGALAERLGVGFAAPADAPGEADLVVHASGRGEGLDTALAAAGDEATVLELSWFGSAPVTVALGEAFHARRLRIVSSQVSRAPPERRARWSNARRMSLALSLLRNPVLDALIDGESAFEALPEVMAAIAAGTGLCHRIRYR